MYTQTHGRVGQTRTRIPTDVVALPAGENMPISPTGVIQPQFEGASPGPVCATGIRAEETEEAEETEHNGGTPGDATAVRVCLWGPRAGARRAEGRQPRKISRPALRALRVAAAGGLCSGLCRSTGAPRTGGSAPAGPPGASAESVSTRGICGMRDLSSACASAMCISTVRPCKINFVCASVHPRKAACFGEHSAEARYISEGACAPSS